MWLPVPATGWRGMYFLPMATCVSNVASPSFGPEPITERLLQIVHHACSSRQWHGELWLQVFVDNLSWDIRLVVWRKFNFCCGTVVSYICVCNVNYSVFLLRISFYICARLVRFM